jgi:predicted secreted hydrolase
MNRRTFVALPLILYPRFACADTIYPSVERGVLLQFPRDHGSHPSFRTEWWYVTGLLRESNGEEFGVQITFFRNRPGIAEEGQSRFAPRQLLFAHAALAVPAKRRLIHDQRAARAGLGLAEAGEATTAVSIDDWSLVRNDGVYVAAIAAREFTLRLTFRVTKPPVLQGDAGVSRKGPRTTQASYYYSVPHLDASGTASIDGKERAVRGVAWLDHEWSSEYLAPEARGWDWIGINLDDGGALMVFRIRDRDNRRYWAGGSHRDSAGRLTVFGSEDVQFQPLRVWRSPRTNIEYPVAFRVTAGPLDVTLEPLFDDQEQDARASVGTIYWEGAVRARRGDDVVGRGYLELTGYGLPLRL